MDTIKELKGPAQMDHQNKRIKSHIRLETEGQNFHTYNMNCLFKASSVEGIITPLCNC